MPVCEPAGNGAWSMGSRSHRGEDLRLPVAGIDLRQTTQGAWYCFEVNPSPGFTFYDTSGQQLIARAIVRLLSQAAVAAQ